MAYCLTCDSEVSAAAAARHLAGDHSPRLPALATCGLPPAPLLDDGPLVGHRRVEREHVVPGWAPWAGRDLKREDQLQGSRERLRDTRRYTHPEVIR